MKTLVFVLLVLHSVFCGVKLEDQFDAQNVWLSVQEQWDTAVNADTNSVLLESSLTNLGSYLTSNTYWFGSEFPSALSGKTAVLNYIRNVEAPRFTNSTRFTASIKNLASQSGTTKKITLSFLVNHYQTEAGSNNLPSTFFQILRLTVDFVETSSNDWKIERLESRIVKDEKDDLVAEIIALREQVSRLQADSDELNHEKELYTIHKNTIETLYAGVPYPNPIPIIQAGAVPNVFDPHVKGRIHPVGVFTDLESTIEYFYGLSPVVPNAPFYIVKQKLVKFINKGNYAASEVIFTTSRSNSANGPELANMTQKGFWRFDDQGKVIEFDLELLNLGLFNLQGVQRDYKSPAVQVPTIAAVCNAANAICTGANKQYDNVTSCIDILTNQKEFGTYDILWDDSVLCRSIHLTLASIRPNIHCSHVGPTGGGKCVKKNYQSLYTDAFFPNDPDRLVN